MYGAIGYFCSTCAVILDFWKPIMWGDGSQGAFSWFWDLSCPFKERNRLTFAEGHVLFCVASAIVIVLILTGCYVANRKLKYKQNIIKIKTKIFPSESDVVFTLIFFIEIGQFLSYGSKRLYAINTWLKQSLDLMLLDFISYTEADQSLRWYAIRCAVIFSFMFVILLLPICKGWSLKQCP